MLQLSDKWGPGLVSQPETGMGYQVASVILKDGSRYDQALIESGFITRIRGLDRIPFREEDIADIVVTHDRWNLNEDHE
jgi:hypothetical protein